MEIQAKFESGRCSMITWFEALQEEGNIYRRTGLPSKRHLAIKFKI